MYLHSATLTSGVTFLDTADGFTANMAVSPDPGGHMQRPVAASQSPAVLLSPHMLALQLPAVMFTVTTAVLFAAPFTAYV